jgi:hypothetical protein
MKKVKTYRQPSRKATDPKVRKNNRCAILDHVLLYKQSFMAVVMFSLAQQGNLKAVVIIPSFIVC